MSLASVSAPVGSAPLGSASSAPGFASGPGPLSGLPQRFASPPGASAPPPSAFAFAPDDPFDPGFADPEALLPPSVPDSIRAEILRMYQDLVDLFPRTAGSPQAPPPSRALFEDFFSPASAPHQPIYLSWFERVRSALSEADSLLASLLASGCSELPLLPPCFAQYAVGGTMHWVPLFLSTRPFWQCSNALFILPSISGSLSARLRCWRRRLAPF